MHNTLTIQYKQCHVVAVSLIAFQLEHNQCHSFQFVPEFLSVNSAHVFTSDCHNVAKYCATEDDMPQ